MFAKIVLDLRPTGCTLSCVTFEKRERLVVMQALGWFLTVNFEDLDFYF